MYHNVVGNSSEIFNLRTHRTVDFENQIRYLSKYFFHTKKQLSTKIEITFDDGLVNNYRFAKPILEKYGIPATFFISTENIDTDILLWPDLLEWLCSVRKAPVTFENVDYFPHPVHGIFINTQGKRLSHELKKKDINEITSFIGELQHTVDRPIPKLLVDTYRTMRSAEILELSQNSLFTIGSHSHKHIPLSGKNEADQYAQLKTSKEILEKITGKTIPDLAFPDGSYDETTLKLGIDLGYTNFYGVLRNETLPLIKSRKGLYTDEPWYYQLAL